MELAWGSQTYPCIASVASNESDWVPAIADVSGAVIPDDGPAGVPDRDVVRAAVAVLPGEVVLPPSTSSIAGFRIPATRSGSTPYQPRV